MSMSVLKSVYLIASRKKVPISFCQKRLSTSFLRFSSSAPCCSDDLMDLNKYEKLSEETLENLSDVFEEIIENNPNFVESDLHLDNGVLTVSLAKFGTYVINKQTPARQIWLSSPISGPKRYDWVDGKWVYKRDQVPLHKLLNEEISKLTGKAVNFTES